MIRIAALLVGVALVVLGLATAPASAAVEVENPGTHQLENELGTAAVGHVGGIETPFFRCDNDWELNIAADGTFEIEVHSIMHHAGALGSCSTAQACNDGAHWEGEIVEADDAFVAHAELCYSQTGTVISNIPFEIECPITNTEIHCDYRVTGEGTPTSPAYEYVGEVGIDADLGLMHVP